MRRQKLTTSSNKSRNSKGDSMQQQFRTSIAQLNRHFNTLLNCARGPRRWGRGRKLLVACALALCLGAPSFAVVQGTFSDVPPTAFYYNAVEAIHRAGITSGCATGLYCPDNAVTRGQMAVFMQRGFSRAYYNWENNLRLTWTTDEIGPAAQVIIDTTDLAPGRKVFVKVDGTIKAYLSYQSSTPDDGYIIGYYLTSSNSNVSIGTDGKLTLSRKHIWASGAVTGVVEVPTGAKTMLGLRVFANELYPGVDVFLDTALTALTAPFGVVGPTAPASSAPESPNDQAPDERSGQQPE
jgi:hypothetical protein